MKITLDSGHYGKYNQGIIKSYYESEFNWKMTNYMKKYLEEYGFHVELTRTILNKDLDLFTRGKISKGSNIFISIHSNACNSETVDYPVVIRGHNQPSTDKLALSIAELISTIMGTKQKGRTYIKTNSKGTEYYGVLRGAESVGVKYRYIVEHSFHTNKNACSFLLEDENIKRLAKAESELIALYFGYKRLEENIKNEKTFLIRVKVDNLNVRKVNDWNYPACMTVNKNEVFTVIDTVEAKNGNTKMYKLKSGLYITTSSKYVELI